MFLLMRILCGLSGPLLRNLRTQPAPRGRAVAGNHCPAGRLDNLGSCEAKEAQSSEIGRAQNAAVSFDILPGGHTLAQPGHYTVFWPQGALIFVNFEII